MALFLFLSIALVFAAANKIDAAKGFFRCEFYAGLFGKAVVSKGVF